MLTANRTNSKSPAQVSVKKSASAARPAGISEADIRGLVAGGRLGRTIPDHEIQDITKGIKFCRWSMLMKAISQCDKRLRVKGLLVACSGCCGRRRSFRLEKVGSANYSLSRRRN